ncbi:hypothetical protein M9H77_25744 [Catharanthus roseus]|uniref:Uncharacterized protein n=1 Tax=Catharanthus roseus TaxID=4058 RepID=A0ACC0A859_CATRO|nr:hypothetical protein M9H77_25744 [Catharanthus roseus]
MASDSIVILQEMYLWNEDMLKTSQNEDLWSENEAKKRRNNKLPKNRVHDRAMQNPRLVISQVRKMLGVEATNLIKGSQIHPHPINYVYDSFFLSIDYENPNHSLGGSRMHVQKVFWGDNDQKRTLLIWSWHQETLSHESCILGIKKLSTMNHGLMSLKS